uniref:Uncharacterized protein n=1 Tax=Brassica oleracea var. oleracea TaxID=109376 RepID=A0A0D3AXK5_BRAOL
MFDKEQTIAELTFLQPEHLNSLVLFSQDFEEKPFDYPYQGPLLDTRRPLDNGLGPIFDEEDELVPTFYEKAPSITSINMENHLCFDPGTTRTPLTTDIQEHWKETLVSDQNKYLSCTYDPGNLIFVLSVQDKQDQSPRGVRNRSIDRAYKFEIWRWKYLRKTTSKLQGKRGNDVPLDSAPGKTDMHGLIMESSKDICSLFDSYLPNQEASTYEITWRMFSTQFKSSSKKNQIKRSSYVTVMPFTNHVIFSSREFRPPEKLEMAILLSDEPTTNSIMPKNTFCFLVRLSPSKQISISLDLCVTSGNV